MTLVNGLLPVIRPVVKVIIKLHRDLEIQSVGKIKKKRGGTHSKGNVCYFAPSSFHSYIFEGHCSLERSFREPKCN